RLGHGELAPVVLDFLDADGTPRLGGGEREGFINRPLGDLSELLLCPGVSLPLLKGPRDLRKRGWRTFSPCGAMAR
ncbi:MAG TPA: hypothetical protein PK393_03155, partial [Synergistaceae bacterium]|nr:hypothetical protein [Synergistaceae bacterium]